MNPNRNPNPRTRPGTVSESDPRSRAQLAHASALMLERIRDEHPVRDLPGAATFASILHTGRLRTEPNEP